MLWLPSHWIQSFPPLCCCWILFKRGWWGRETVYQTSEIKKRKAERRRRNENKVYENIFLEFTGLKCKWNYNPTLVWAPTQHLKQAKSSKMEKKSLSGCLCTNWEDSAQEKEVFYKLFFFLSTCRCAAHVQTGIAVMTGNNVSALPPGLMGMHKSAWSLCSLLCAELGNAYCQKGPRTLLEHRLPCSKYLFWILVSLT